MNICKINGAVDRIESSIVVIVPDNQDDREYYFNLGDFDTHEISEGIKIEVLATVYDDYNQVSKLISYKVLSAPKPMKIMNFSSLIKQMERTLERLLATKDSLPSNVTDYSLEEKISYLKKGLNIFKE